MAKTNTSSPHFLDPLSLSVTVDILVSDQLRDILQWVLLSVACQAVDLFGIAANIINAICFIKQGFKDSVNVSFFGLTISDLGCLAPLVFTNICFNPAFQATSLPFEPVELQYLISAWPHIIFSRVTSWITALITLERCLCIMIPLKIKRVITPGRVAITITGLFVLLIASASPIYYVNGFGWRFSPEKNRTILGLAFTADRTKVEDNSFLINNICVPFTAFALVIVCTITLVVNLRSKTKWREQATGQAHVINTRDRKVTRLVVVISTLFIGCYFPTCAIFITILLEPEIAVDGRYRNTTIVLICFSFFLESTNSAMNIFFYYNMSSKYRSVFRQLFRLEGKK